MKPTEFVKVNSQFWGEHLKSVSEHLPTSHSRELAGVLVYPRQLVLTETPDWNILELVGVSREYRSLEVRRQKAASIDEYFADAKGSKPVLILRDEDVYQDATIATEAGRKALGTRYPGAQSERELVGTGDGKLLQFAPGNYSALHRVLLVTDARAHWTFLAIAIHRSEPADKYRAYLDSLVNSAPHLDPVGTLSVPPSELLKSEPFGSTYQHGLHKTTVGEFLQQHEGILLAAFDATQLVREPVLEREDGTAVTPDFILERADGTHIIGDLALPLLETAKDGKKRKRPTTASDGVARLTQYEDYFQSSENRAFATTKYGVEVTSPRKLLILAGQEQTTDKVESIDYDTILRLALTPKTVTKTAASGISSVAILGQQ
ncbi:hypothetical protein [Kribbella catacumbae]|uniref:hypothetical protein n=1 Tax=Kribbella catacumbae TaxID=460086 RepID=UPI000360E308|nr:hypothetical protein [Kribbella catacumbae]